jgi:ribonuclease HI
MAPLSITSNVFRDVTQFEHWSISTGYVRLAPPEVKGLVWYTDGSKMKEGTGAGFFGQSVKRRLSFSLGRHTTVFQAEIFAILACVYETFNRSEKYISICSDSQAALKALKAVSERRLLWFASVRRR